jgi:hypothetical protein
MVVSVFVHILSIDRQRLHRVVLGIEVGHPVDTRGDIPTGGSRIGIVIGVEGLCVTFILDFPIGVEFGELEGVIPCVG